ncbi:hypothetical protein BX070DRAFT_185006, partial [Coemansia spiralis]
AQVVAIIGTTGIQGSSVLCALCETGKYNLVAITRNTSSEPAKVSKQRYPDVEFAEANTDETESLKKAFKNVEIVYGVAQLFDPEVLAKALAGDLDTEYKQGKNTIDVAIAAGIDKIIYSSLPSIKEIFGGKYSGVLYFEGKYKVEQYLWSKASKIRGAIVQVGCYVEDFVGFSGFSSEDNKTAEFISPVASSTKLPLVDAAKDTGGAVAYILDHFDNFVGKPFKVNGGYYSMQEAVKTFRKATGKPARYVHK